MSGIFTGSIWSKFDIKKRIWVDVVGWSALFLISIVMLVCLGIDQRAAKIYQWANFFLIIAAFYCLIITLCLVGLNLKGKQFIPLVLFMLLTGHILAVFLLLFFAVNIHGLDIGFGGGVTLGLFGLIFLVALRDSLGDFRERKFWKKWTPELRKLKEEKLLTFRWRFLLFFWKPKLIADKEKNPVRDFFEGILMAFILALIIRTHCLEAYEIPTGSMKPTLWGISIGSEGEIKKQVRDGDRILVNKSVYGVREPQRWDVIVFKYSLNSMKNFIKRLIGMPEEQLLIYKGDIWRRPAKNGVPDESADFEIVQKPEEAQDALWSLFYSYKYESSMFKTDDYKGCKADIYPLRVGVPIENDWTPTLVPETIDSRTPILRTSSAKNRPFLDWEYDEKTDWETIGEGKDVAFRADVKNSNPSALGFAKYINDRFTLPRDDSEYKTFEYRDKQEFEQNESASPQGFAPVADIRFKSVWKFDDDESQAIIQYQRTFSEIGGDATIVVELIFGVNKFEIQAKVQKDFGGEQLHKPKQDLTELIKENGIKLEPGKEFSLDIAYVDGDVILRINERNILRWTLEQPVLPSRDVNILDPNEEIYTPVLLRIIMNKGAGEFKYPEIWRDIYYRPDGECNPAIVVPANSYFTLGDNCKNSKDSRLWYKGIFSLINSSPILEENCESDDVPENWLLNGDWEWGKPNPAFGPRRNHTKNGTKCFGTGMKRNYSSNQKFDECSLVSPIINLESARHPRLMFYQWFEFDPNDGGKVQISKDAGKNWADLRITPSPPYKHNSRGNSMFLGRSDWDLVIADLSDYKGEKEVRIRWAFQSNESAETKGWFIDDIVVIDTLDIKTEMDPSSDSKSMNLSILRTSRSEVQTNNIKYYEDDLKELKRNYDFIFIEDINGVTRRIDTAKIISFDVLPASFVPVENLLGRAMIRFWPPKFIKFIK